MDEAVGMARIVVVGSLNIDLVAIAPRIPVAGETILGSHFFTAPGGKGANQAYAAAKLNGETAMLGCVGDDDFGRSMRKNLSDVGCNVDGVRQVDGPSGVALIFVSEKGENCIVVAPGANDKLQPHDIVLGDCSVMLLQLETPIETVIAAARYARERGATVILDPAPAPTGGLPRELLQAVDILTPNETEAAMLAGMTTGDPMAVSERLKSLGPRTLILKLGEQGCLLVDGGQTHRIAAPKVRAIDTTAAGDVFNGALAVALSEGLSLKQGCEFAVRAAAISVTRLGAQSSAPTRSEV
jgi:ribokinase